MGGISEFSGLEPWHIIPDDGLVDDSLYREQIQPYARDYLADFQVDASDLSDDDLAALTLADFRELLCERYEPNAIYERSTLGAYERASAFIASNRSKPGSAVPASRELPPPTIALRFPPIVDDVDQITALKGMVFPILDAAHAGLEKLTTAKEFQIPEHPESSTSLRPLTLNLFTTFLATYFGGTDISRGFGEEINSSGDYLSAALKSLTPEWHDTLGPELARGFSHITIANGDTSSMHPIEAMDTVGLADFSRLSDLSVDPEHASLFQPQAELIALAQKLIAAHPEILLQLGSLERTAPYQKLLGQVDEMKTNIANYRAELDAFTGANRLDNLEVQKFIAMVPNPEAQTALLANLGIDPRIDPDGEKPSWIGEACWKTSQQYAWGERDLNIQEIGKSLAGIAVMAFLGSNPAFAAVGMAAGALLGPAFAVVDILHEKSSLTRAQTARLASQVVPVDESPIASQDMPALATDHDVDAADQRLSYAIEKVPVELALNFIGMGEGAAAKQLFESAGAFVLDMTVQTAIGGAQAFNDQRNWSTDEHGNSSVATEALVMGAVFAFAGAGLGHAVGGIQTSVPRNADGVPTQPFILVRNLGGKNVEITVRPEDVTWQGMTEGKLRGRLVIGEDKIPCDVEIDFEKGTFALTREGVPEDSAKPAVPKDQAQRTESPKDTSAATPRDDEARLQINASSYSAEAFGAAIKSLADKTSVGTPRVELKIKVDDVTKIRSLEIISTIRSAFKERDTGFVHVIFEDAASGRNLPFDVEAKGRCPALDTPPGTPLEGTAVIRRLYGENAGRITKRVAAWAESEQERFYQMVAAIDSEINTQRPLIRGMSGDKGFVFVDPRGQINDLCDKIDLFYKPIIRGEKFRRLNATPQQVTAFQNSHPKPPNYREAPGITGSFFGKDGTPCEYRVPDYVIKKLDSWILERSFGVTTEVKGVFTTERLADGTILITDFIPSASFSDGKVIRSDPDAMMQSLDVNKLSKEERFVLGISDTPSTATPIEGETIPVHSHYTDSKYQERPSDGDFSSPLDAIWALRTPSGGLMLYATGPSAAKHPKARSYAINPRPLERN